mmetsp:Transcript_11587/g.36010  ORF Transcript_11587/g.36010 Transcript_11587/m.36010 type:complete len:311 (-) Transcript_11587:277-1209(-)
MATARSLRASSTLNVARSMASSAACTSDSSAGSAATFSMCTTSVSGMRLTSAESLFPSPSTFSSSDRRRIACSVSSFIELKDGDSAYVWRMRESSSPRRVMPSNCGARSSTSSACCRLSAASRDSCCTSYLVRSFQSLVPSTSRSSSAACRRILASAACCERRFSHRSWRDCSRRLWCACSSCCCLRKLKYSALAASGGGALGLLLSARDAFIERRPLMPTLATAVGAPGAGEGDAAAAVDSLAGIGDIMLTSTPLRLTALASACPPAAAVMGPGVAAGSASGDGGRLPVVLARRSCADLKVPKEEPLEK